MSTKALHLCPSIWMMEDLPSWSLGNKDFGLFLRNRGGQNHEVVDVPCIAEFSKGKFSSHVPPNSWDFKLFDFSSPDGAILVWGLLVSVLLDKNAMN